MADTTYWFNGNREDLLDIIVNITPTVTPIFSSIPHPSCEATYHEWVLDELKSPNDNNALIEGADTTFPQATKRSRVGNYTQIFENAFAVSETQDVVSKAGIKSEYAYQATKAMKEHVRDIEKCIIVNGDAVAGDASTPRKFAGMEKWIDDANKVDAGGDALTVDDVDQAIQLAWEAGGNPTVAFMSGTAKRRFTKASGSVTDRTVPGSAHREIQRTDIYEGEVGTIQIRPHRMIVHDSTTAANNKIFILDLDYWKFAFLRRTKEERLAKTGDSYKGRIVSEGTLVGLAPKANAMVHNFTA